MMEKSRGTAAQTVLSGVEEGVSEAQLRAGLRRDIYLTRC